MQSQYLTKVNGVIPDSGDASGMAGSDILAKRGY